MKNILKTLETNGFLAAQQQFRLQKNGAPRLVAEPVTFPFMD
jgi:hypothetical protein